MSPRETLSLYIDEAKKDLTQLETISWPADRSQLSEQIASLRNFIDSETQVIGKLKT